MADGILKIYTWPVPTLEDLLEAIEKYERTLKTFRDNYPHVYISHQVFVNPEIPLFTFQVKAWIKFNGQDNQGFSEEI